MTSKHRRIVTASLSLALIAGCGVELDEALEREASGARAAEEPAGTLSPFAGRFDQVDPEGNVLDGSSLVVSVQGQTFSAVALVDGASRTIMRGVVGAEPEVEKYTVSSEGFLGPASLERRKIVTSLRMAGDARSVERKVEMYAWEVSLKIWEDWTLYGVITDRLVLVDAEHLAWDHFESQYDRASRYLYLRN